jgi:hypothetical protein
MKGRDKQKYALFHFAVTCYDCVDGMRIKYQYGSLIE